MLGTTPATNIDWTPFGTEEGSHSKPTSPNINPIIDITIFDQLIFSSSKTGRQIILRISWTLVLSVSYPVSTQEKLRIG